MNKEDIEKQKQIDQALKAFLGEEPSYKLNGTLHQIKEKPRKSTNSFKNYKKILVIILFLAYVIYVLR